MNEEREMNIFEEDEIIDFSIEELTDIQGGVEDDFAKGECGLGCFLGAGYGPIKP
jgi:hypothetical protein